MDQARFKMRVLAGAVLCGVFASLCLARGADDPVRRRLREMKGEDVQAAQVAEMELVAMGENAVGPIKEILEVGEKEALRAEALRVYPAVLEKAGRLTRLTMNLEGARMRDVAAELNARLERGKITLPDATKNQKATIHWDKIPYTQALVEIGKATQSVAQGGQNNAGIMFIVDPGSENRPVFFDSGNVVMLNALQWEKKKEFGSAKPGTSVMRAMIQTHYDPKLMMILKGYCNDVKAIDETGRKFKYIPGSSLKPEMRISQKSCEKWEGIITSDLYFEFEEGSPKRVSLSGKIMGLAAFDPESWSINDLSKVRGAVREFGKLKLSLSEAYFEGSDFYVNGSLGGVQETQWRELLEAGLEQPQTTAHRVFSQLLDGIKVQTMDGKTKWETKSFQTRDIKNSGPDSTWSCGFSLRFSDPSGQSEKNLKLEIVMPKKIEEIQTNFEFKDIKIP